MPVASHSSRDLSRAAAKPKMKGVAIPAVNSGLSAHTMLNPRRCGVACAIDSLPVVTFSTLGDISWLLGWTSAIGRHGG
ncbi:hypothetical protein GCM10022416_28620 [Actinomadura keratinilytica]|uniref:Uncharacterized protein n=1 Tax=Actinomadura keratinilytica TaxID=547461 RepID=A0ABP7YTD7_9ACTN